MIISAEYSPLDSILPEIDVGISPHVPLFAKALNYLCAVGKGL